MGFECYRIGDLLLDAGTQEVTRDGATVQIPRLSFKLLLSLARHAPNVVSTDQLEKEVWEGLVVDRGTVNKRVLLLRKALGDGAGEEPYITVIRGSGYRLIAQVERVPHASAEPLQETASQQSWYQKTSAAIRTTSYWLLGIVAVLALYQGLQNPPSEVLAPASLNTASTTAAITPTYSQKTVAVLPFVDLSDGLVHQYLGDGIAEEVINLLAGMDGLEVAARTSSFAFQDTASNITDIANALKVGTILEGSIRHSDKRIRVTAQLIDTQTGYHIWSKNYDRAFNEVFEVQDDIAFNIAESLKLTLDENYQPDSRKATTGDIEAFALYLKGRELLNDRIHLRAGGLNDALVFFTLATEKDPEFARAHAGIATVNWLLSSYDDALDRKTHFELAEASANFALEFDPNLTDALGTLAAICSSRGEIEQAAILFDKVRGLGSKDSNIAHWEAMLHIRLGYFNELVAPLTEVYRLDPLNEHIGWSLAAALNFAGEPEKATVILESLEHFTYRQYVLGLAAINRKDYSTARELIRDVRMRSGKLSADHADMIIDALENPELIEETAQKIVAAVRSGDLESVVGFESLLVLGSPQAFDLGFDPLNDIIKVQMLGQVWNNWGVAIRQDPRFKEWVESLGYVDFWRKYGWPDRCGPTGPNDFECI